MFSLLKLEHKHKNYSNPFRIRILLFLSFSFGIEMINTFIYSVVPSKTIPDSRPKWAKCIPVFRPKRPKNPTRWGGIYLYGLYRGAPPPPPQADAEDWRFCKGFQLVHTIEGNTFCLTLHALLALVSNTYQSHIGVTNGLCEHSLACRALRFFCEHEQQ